MKARALAIAAAVLIGVLRGDPAHADEIKAGDLVISQPWSRETPRGAPVASGYLTIENKGAAEDRLLGGSTDIASKVDVHEMATNGGVMSMRTLNSGLPLPAGATVTLAPAHYHLMLNELKRQLKQGDSVAITLSFEKAGNVLDTFPVLGVGAKGPAAAAAPAKGGAMDHGNMDHGKMKM
jgi:hypothetical protein